MKPRTLSLFAGYGGLDMAVEEVTGGTVAYVADIDPGACKVLAHRYPDAPNLGDVTTADWDALVGKVEAITGGSPCQDLSHAGRRAGMTEGTRSNLWVAMREAVATIRPQLVVWENVRGAMSAAATSDLESCPGCMGDAGDRGPDLRALGRVLGDLADLGYDAQWHGLRVADLGGCHGRWRVFVLAVRRDVAAVAGRECGQVPPAGRLAAVAQLGGNGDPGRAGLTLLPTPAASVANDGESPDTWLARRERVKQTANNGNGMGMPLTIAVQLLPTPRVENNENRQSEGYGGVRGNFHGLLTGAVSWGEYAEAIARHERAFGRPAPESTELGPKGKPRLSARFVEWMMCLPDGWVTDVPGITRNEALRALGHGVVPMQAAHALHLMIDRARGVA